jgi:hypothetical protein
VLSSNSTVFASSGLQFPFSLAFDSTGSLYVSAYQSVEEVGSSGVVTHFATVTSGASEVYGLVFQPVPEPSTWALLAVGLIALLSVRYRRSEV